MPSNHSTRSTMGNSRSGMTTPRTLENGSAERRRGAPEIESTAKLCHLTLETENALSPSCTTIRPSNRSTRTR